MTTLRLEIDLGFEDDGEYPYTLNRTYLRKARSKDDSQTSPPPAIITVTDATLIHRGSYVRVYRAKMYGPQGQVRDIIAKIAFSEGEHLILKEGKFYENQLFSLQGDAVPRCFGFFEVEYELETISALLLEDCGTVMKGSFFEADMPTKLKLLEKLDKIHGAGLVHLDIAPRNVVTKDGELFWIDFEHSARHACPRTHTVRPGEFKPNVGDFGCVELYEFIERLGFWKSTYVNFHGFTVALQAVNSPQVLYDSVYADSLETEEEREQVWQDAIKAYKAVAEDHKLYASLLRKRKQQRMSGQNVV
ncbi:hypothetical protein JAAARDRAFT_162938 [Jaapia argillacea MUCL 33604]|uniref:Protein kinase domain-containing protein n=1 Tax=Jaapia argillacea MUCL 33604 TaxID=933084 RepID=A0A067PBA1_9AGAM|nr:hypothetical protein JAAARDRAFT_162938 [Jaapia argillacea MUCL 33604]